MLDGKKIVVGVTGGIAAYKACEIVSGLKKLGAEINVIMTESATKFVAPLTFETLSKNPVAGDMFADKPRYDVEHISLAKKADLMVIAPATADIMAKLSVGIADDMLTTTALACPAQKLLCPSMNTNMYMNPITQKNMRTLSEYGYDFIQPSSGLLACGDIGKGRLSEPAEIIARIEYMLNAKKDFAGKRILITAGATSEPIDGVRCITNYSSGKMGVALAKAALARGAEVLLVVGRISVPLPYGIESVSVETTAQMYDAVMSRVDSCDIIIKAAAPADYRVKTVFQNKIKTAELVLEFEKNPDIAAAVGKVKGDRKLIIFCAETERLQENAQKKLVSKNADMVIANDVTREGAGFNSDTNIITIIDKKGNRVDCDRQPKSVLSDIILDKVLVL